MGKNAIVGQSGGPTSVINASLAGVFESCKSRGAEIVYGMCNGVAGLLEERVVDLSTVLTDDLDIELLKRTPSSFLGSCRYKLPDWHDDETVYKKLFAILEKLNIGYFFYIGGNDSMDTIGKLAEYGNRIQSDIRFMGVPKTIDNDLMVTDHTPGYGSAAKYIGVVMKEIIRDATVYGTNYVTVVEIMGRNAGWLTAAAALGQSDAEQLKIEHRIELAEGLTATCATLLQDLDKAKAAKADAEEKQHAYAEAQAALDELETAHIAMQRQLNANRAGLLAQELVDGQPCPVCGAVHHPHPAALPQDHVTEKALEDHEKTLTAQRRKTADASRAAGDADAERHDAQPRRSADALREGDGAPASSNGSGGGVTPSVSFADTSL